MTVGQTIRIALDQIATHQDFSFRGYIDRPHLRDLRQVLTNNPRKLLDPLIVWQDEAGGYVLLDGHHRAEAYRQASQAGRKVPVRVFEGDRRGAVLVALKSNAKAHLPLSCHERQDAAWRLVRMPQETRYSKAEISDAASVSERQVAYMRKRWKEVQGADGVAALTGRWRFDKGGAAQRDDWEPMKDAERERQIEALTVQTRDHFDRRKRKDEFPVLCEDDALFEVLLRALGEAKLKGCMEYLFDAEAEERCLPFMGFHSDEQDFTEHEVNPDF